LNLRAGDFKWCHIIDDRKNDKIWMKSASASTINSPYLSPSDLHLFGSLKDGLCGKHFCDNKAVIISETMDCFSRCQLLLIHTIMHLWQKCIENDSNYVEKRLEEKCLLVLMVLLVFQNAQLFGSNQIVVTSV